MENEASDGLANLNEGIGVENEAGKGVGIENGANEDGGGVFPPPDVENEGVPGLLV